MLLRLSGASQRHNLIPFGGRRCAVFRPCIHQPAALLERRATPVCGLRLIFDRVRQRGLDHIAGKRRAAWQPKSQASRERKAASATQPRNMVTPCCFVAFS